MELEGRARPLLMLKEWLELESSAELSRDGFGCYPRRQLAAELRGGGSGRRRNGAVIERVSAAVRAALLIRPSSAREGGEAALSKSYSRRLRRGFWRKRRGQGDEVNSRVDSCSAAAVSGRDDGSSPAMSPRRRSWEGGHAGGAAGRQGHETQVARKMECEATCHLDEELEQGQRRSPVSVMDFLSQDEEDDDGEVEHGNGNSEYDDVHDSIASPTFQQSLANIRSRAASPDSDVEVDGGRKSSGPPKMVVCTAATRGGSLDSTVSSAEFLAACIDFVEVNKKGTNQFHCLNVKPPIAASAKFLSLATRAAPASPLPRQPTMMETDEPVPILLIGHLSILGKRRSAMDANFQCGIDGSGCLPSTLQDRFGCSLRLLENSSFVKLVIKKGVGQQLLQKIRQFEQLAELDASDVDDTTIAKKGIDCHVADSDSMEDDTEEAFVQDLVDLLEASSPGSTRCFQKLIVDFFYDGLPPWQGGRLDGPDRAKLLLEIAKAWLDGQDFSSRLDGKAEVEEIERLGRWRCFKEDEQELVAVDLEGEIFCSLVAEMVGELG